jgi:hypothetical protein
MDLRAGGQAGGRLAAPTARPSGEAIEFSEIPGVAKTQPAAPMSGAALTRLSVVMVGPVEGTGGG